MAPDMWKESAYPMQYSHHIDVEHPPPIVERDVVDAAARADTGIVANDMHLFECIVRCLGSLLDAVRLGNITSNSAYPTETLYTFASRLQCVDFAVSDHD